MTSHIPVTEDRRIGRPPWTYSAARMLLGVMLALAPLAFGGVYTWGWASITIATLLLLILWMMGTMREGRLKIGYSPLYLPFALFLAVGLIQLTLHLTLTPVDTKEALFKLATDFVLFFVVIQLFSDSPAETWRRVGFAVLVFGFVFSFLSILQFFWNPNRIFWVGKDVGAPFGPYVDRDHYAGLMEMVIPISASYVLSRPKRDPLNGLLWFAVLVPIVSLLLTGSRGGFISLLAEIAILAWIVLWRNPRPGRGMRVATTGLVLVAGAALFFWLVPGYVLSKIGTVKNYVPEARQGSRPILWKNSLEIFRNHPVAGTGLGSFVSVFPAHQTEAVDLTIEHAHNDYVEVLTETGVLGGVLVLATMLLFFRITFRNMALQLKYEPGWMQLGGTIACCGLAVHSFVDFNLHIPANAAWFAFCAGIASLSGRSAAKQAK